MGFGSGLKKKAPFSGTLIPNLLSLESEGQKHDHETNYCDHNFADVPETDGNQAVNKKD